MPITGSMKSQVSAHDKGKKKLLREGSPCRLWDSGRQMMDGAQCCGPVGVCLRKRRCIGPVGTLRLLFCETHRETPSEAAALGHRGKIFSWATCAAVLSRLVPGYPGCF